MAKVKFTLKDLIKKGFSEVSKNCFAPGPKGVNHINVSSKPKDSKIIKIDLFCKIIEQKFNVLIVQEYTFHHERKWRFDYAIPNLKIAIEQEGGIWLKGKSGHSSGKGISRDMEKYNEANLLGWIVIRRTPEQLIKQETLNLVKCAIERRAN